MTFYTIIIANIYWALYADIITCALHSVTYLILTTTVNDRYSFIPYFMDKDVDTVRE